MVMTPRECFNRIMNYESVDRLPAFVVEPFEETAVKRWVNEGLDITSTLEDVLGIAKFTKIPAHLSPKPRFEHKIFYEDDEYIIETDTTYGAKVKKAKKAPTMYYGYMGHQVKNSDDWYRIKYRYEGDLTKRIPKDIDEIAEQLNTSPNPVKLEIFPYFFRLGFYLMGMENFMLAFYDQPDLIHEMFSFWNDFALSIIKPYLERVKIDIFVLMEDLAHNSAPHMSPEVYKEFWLPYQNKLISEVKKYQINNICLWTAGDIEVMIPMLMDNGINCLWPVERCSPNMDPYLLRKKYGKELRMNGGVPWKCLIEGPEAIDREVEKLIPLIQDGGFIPALDDMVSPEIPLENYIYYVNKLKSIRI